MIEIQRVIGMGSFDNGFRIIKIVIKHEVYFWFTVIMKSVQSKQNKSQRLFRK